MTFFLLLFPHDIIIVSQTSMNTSSPSPTSNSPSHSPTSPSGDCYNYYLGGGCLPHDAYKLSILSTRILVSRLAFTVHDLERQMSEMSIRHKESEQESQMEIYCINNKLKDFQELQTGKVKCDSQYYLHKYLQKKKLMVFSYTSMDTPPPSPDTSMDTSSPSPSPSSPSRSPSPSSPSRSPVSPSGDCYNYYEGGGRFPHHNYKLNILSTRIVLSRLAVTVHDLERQMSEMSIRHEESEQESQMEIYWIKNKLKDFQEQQTGKFHEAKCDAQYYLHKYLQKKKLMN